MKITVIDGQGGRIGKTVIEQIRAKHKNLEPSAPTPPPLPPC